MWVPELGGPTLEIFLPTNALNPFHEKAGRGQDTLRFFLSVSLFPFS